MLKPSNKKTHSVHLVTRKQELQEQELGTYLVLGISLRGNKLAESEGEWRATCVT